MTATTGNVKAIDELRASQEDYDQSTVENEGPRYPIIQWVNGQPRNASIGGIMYTGGWFIAHNNIPAALNEAMPQPWQPYTMTWESGEQTEGYAVQNITVALIRGRKGWLVQQGDKRVLKPWRGGFTPGARGKSQILVALQGIEQTPFVLTLTGKSAQFLTETTQQFQQNIVSPANKVIAPKRFPHRAFWLTLGPAIDGKGKPLFVEVGQKGATSRIPQLTAIDLPDAPINPDDAVNHFVGRALLKTMELWYTAADDWAAQWDTQEAINAAGDAAGLHKGGNGSLAPEPLEPGNADF